MRYSEHVHSPGGLTIAVLATTVAMCVLGLWLLVVTGEVLGGLILAGTGGALTGMVRAFPIVRIEVDESTLRVRLGPFGFTLHGQATRKCASRRTAGWRTVAGACAGARTAGAPQGPAPCRFSAAASLWTPGTDTATT